MLNIETTEVPGSKYVDRMGYDSQRRIARIKFRNGMTVDFHNVSELEYHGWLTHRGNMTHKLFRNRRWTEVSREYADAC
jgi:hypothetical protein